MSEPETKSHSTLNRVCPECGRRFTDDLKLCPNDGALLEKKGDLIGTIFAKKYEISSKLGEGGMAEVYKAKHIHMQREVAIKMLKKHLVADAVAFKRFEQESQAASSLSHPNIVTVYDFGEEDEIAYFVMDCVEGPTLAARIDQIGPLPESEALDIFAQLCEGLSHAHRKGVVHRDLKPSNIILVKQEDGTTLVKIVDFGIAKLMPSAGKHIQQLTQSGEVFGSPLYMSPEQCLGTSPDQRSDIYSLGCLMYQAVTGMLPLFGDTAYETMNKHVSTMPLAFRQLNPDLQVSAQTEAVIFKCLQKDPAHRYQSAAAVLADLPLEGRAPLAATVANVPIDKSNNSTGGGRLFYPQVIAFALVFTAISGWFFFRFEGASADRGTPYHKTFWNVCMFLGELTTDWNQYRASIWFFDRAREHAKTIQDQHVKLLASLSEEKEPYEKLNQPDKVAELENLSAKYTRELVLNKARKLMDLLTAARDSKAPLDGRLTAAVLKLREVIISAAQLQHFKYYKEERRLLELALDKNVYRRALAENDLQIARLDLQLGRCYQLLSQIDEAGTCYREAYRICNAVEPGSQESLDALLVLGIFEKDASNWIPSRKHLGEALQQARANLLKNKSSDNEDFYQQCRAAYKDLIKQISLDQKTSSFSDQTQKFYDSMTVQ